MARKISFDAPLDEINPVREEAVSPSVASAPWDGARH